MDIAGLSDESICMRIGLSYLHVYQSFVHVLVCIDLPMLSCVSQCPYPHPETTTRRRLIANRNVVETREAVGMR